MRAEASDTAPSEEVPTQYVWRDGSVHDQPHVEPTPSEEAKKLVEESWWAASHWGRTDHGYDDARATCAALSTFIASLESECSALRASRDDLTVAFDAVKLSAEIHREALERSEAEVERLRSSLATAAEKARRLTYENEKAKHDLDGGNDCFDTLAEAVDATKRSLASLRAGQTK